MWQKQALLHFPTSIVLNNIRESPIVLANCSGLYVKHGQRKAHSGYKSNSLGTGSLTKPIINRKCSSLDDDKGGRQLHIDVIQHCRGFSTATGTVDSDEINQFKQFGTTWWDASGPLKALHSMNKLRIPFIRDGLINTNIVKKEMVNSPKPLKGINILDVGCGGGILSEPLAKIGAEVTGIDANPEVIELAKSHAEQSRLHINYCSTSIEDYKGNSAGKYDAVIASEIVEHVTKKNEFIESCTQCIKPGGSIFITTLSKTALANLLAIVISENISLVPKGTHQFDKFIEPHKLQRILEDSNCKTELIHGMFYNFITNTWHWCSNTTINYAIHAIKL